MILVTLGTGVGGGIIIDSKIIAGYHGAGGEIGHACVNHNEVRPCNCGNHGCLEQYASATGIVRVANDILEESKEDSKMRHVEKLSAKMFLTSTRRAMLWLLRLWRRLATFLEAHLPCLHV